MEYTLDRQLRTDTELCENQTSTYWTRFYSHFTFEFLSARFGQERNLTPSRVSVLAPSLKWYPGLCGPGHQNSQWWKLANWNWCLFPKSFIKWLSSSEGLSKSKWITFVPSTDIILYIFLVASKKKDTVTACLDTGSHLRLVSGSIWKTWALVEKTGCSLCKKHKTVV